MVRTCSKKAQWNPFADRCSAWSAICVEAGLFCRAGCDGRRDHRGTEPVATSFYNKHGAHAALRCPPRGLNLRSKYRLCVHSRFSHSEQNFASTPAALSYSCPFSAFKHACSILLQSCVSVQNAQDLFSSICKKTCGNFSMRSSAYHAAALRRKGRPPHRECTRRHMPLKRLHILRAQRTCDAVALQTSPLPPFAMPGLPVVFTRVSPLGAAIIVPAPFSTVITRYVCAKTRAVCKRSARSSAMVRPFRRHISPGCGVMMTGACSTSSFSGVLARIFSASASRTTVPCAFREYIHKFCHFSAPSPEPAAHKARTRLIDSIKHRFARRFRGVIQREDCLRHGGSQDWVQRMRNGDVQKSHTAAQRRTRSHDACTCHAHAAADH